MPTTSPPAPAPGSVPDAASGTGKRRRSSARALLRAMHRDMGYVVVGLTFIYALSGLAVNHIGHWDPNFTQVNAEHALKGPLPTGDDDLAKEVARQLERGAPKEIYRASPEQLDLVFEHTTIRVDAARLSAVEEGQKPRLLLHVANWLHLNRGKVAWRYIADAYAVILLVLATSGMFMIPGKKGIRGRGAVFVGLGIAVPVVYVVLSGGP